jgi:hypothetical protein
VRRGAAYLDVVTVRFEHPRHRVLAAPVFVVVIVIPVTHPLVVVLTVSHVSPSVNSLDCSALSLASLEPYVS